MDGGTTARTSIFLQDACYRHRYIRSNDLSTIVERPERLRALKIGFAAVIARIEQEITASEDPSIHSASDIARATGDDLVVALQKLDLLQEARVDVVDIINSPALVNLLSNKAVKFVHGDINGDVYLENLVKWANESSSKIKQEGSEIPSHLPQGDLYLCPESLDAIQGALGTVCEAVDKVIGASRQSCGSDPGARIPQANAFVAIRPPGHHCGEDRPSGFCFVNNVVVAAAHAHLTHGIKKVVILDIDLHHGNGTQSLAWQINEETYRQKLEAEGAPTTSSGLQIFYGSIHDVLSFPCEDGNISMVQAASVSIHGLHGQHVENIHLQKYHSEDHFWNDLYPNNYSKLLKKAESFVEGSAADDVLVFISCGFDACEHEYSSMSRHNRRVPTSFYHRFAVDARELASNFAMGKLISVLEGGYSDRALTSGGMAHLSGLVDTEALGASVDESWWDVSKLTLLEKFTKKRRGGKTSIGGNGEKWLERALAILHSIDTEMTPSPSKIQANAPPSSMTLRERKPVNTPGSPKGSQAASRRAKGKAAPIVNSAGGSPPSSVSVDEVLEKFQDLDLKKMPLEPESSALNSEKKVARVILRVKEPTEY